MNELSVTWCETDGMRRANVSGSADTVENLKDRTRIKRENVN